jgi:hypothetical protein
VHLYGGVQFAFNRKRSLFCSAAASAEVEVDVVEVGCKLLLNRPAITLLVIFGGWTDRMGLGCVARLKVKVKEE